MVTKLTTDVRDEREITMSDVDRVRDAAASAILHVFYRDVFDSSGYFEYKTTREHLMAASRNIDKFVPDGIERGHLERAIWHLAIVCHDEAQRIMKAS